VVYGLEQPGKTAMLILLFLIYTICCVRRTLTSRNDKGLDCFRELHYYPHVPFAWLSGMASTARQGAAQTGPSSMKFSRKLSFSLWLALLVHVHVW
jgi:hypothetical protein